MTQQTIPAPPGADHPDGVPPAQGPPGHAPPSADPREPLDDLFRDLKSSPEGLSAPARRPAD